MSLAAILHLAVLIGHDHVILAIFLPDNTLAGIVFRHRLHQLIAYHFLAFLGDYRVNIFGLDCDDAIGINQLQRWQHGLDKHLQATETLNLSIDKSLEGIFPKDWLKLGVVSDAPILVRKGSAYCGLKVLEHAQRCGLVIGFDVSSLLVGLIRSADR